MDAHLAQDSESRVACETLVKTGAVVLGGEVTSKAVVDYQVGVTRILLLMVTLEEVSFLGRRLIRLRN